LNSTLQTHLGVEGPLPLRSRDPSTPQSHNNYTAIQWPILTPPHWLGFTPPLTSPPFFRQSLAQVRRRSWAPNCSIPICFDDCSTTDQTAQSLSVSRLIFPLFEINRSRRPSSMPAAVIQVLIPCLTQMGTLHETEIYVRLQRVDVMFSIVYPDTDNELHPVQERRILYLDLADYERLR
jgi:hypothetical protein